MQDQHNQQFFDVNTVDPSKVPRCICDGEPYMVARTAGQHTKNPGREFFSCVNGSKKGCNSFQWVDEMKVVDGIAQLGDKDKKKRKLESKIDGADAAKKLFVELRKDIADIMEKTITDLHETKQLNVELRKDVADMQKTISELKSLLEIRIQEAANGGNGGNVLRNIGATQAKKK